ncbi:UNVERIFIED_CONTAM: hypothetical protein Scaly_3008000 [Sesamum calycinum]|uniref:DUF4283 domain-containing protein n=1 Tax=Sesamum calycinum TaxID=2727403 RepID=A0AAW2KDQ6_9LAMI
MAEHHQAACVVTRINSSDQILVSVVHKRFPHLASNRMSFHRFAIHSTELTRPSQLDHLIQLGLIKFQPAALIHLLKRTKLIFSDEETKDLAASLCFALVGKFSHGPPLYKHMHKLIVDYESSIVPLWVNFPELPAHLFKKDALFAVASIIGVPLQLDTLTVNQATLTRARICIEVDLSKPLVEEFDIQIQGATIVQRVEYEQAPTYCNLCKQVGHQAAACYIKANYGHEPWIIGGDFNIILTAEEKRGGAYPKFRAMEEFADTVLECGLIDAGFEGSEYTWSNRITWEDWTDSSTQKLDLMFSPPPESSIFPELGQIMRPFSLTLNTPLSSHHRHSDSCKLYRLKQHLKWWNKNIFGDLFANMRMAQELVLSKEKAYVDSPMK